MKKIVALLLAAVLLLGMLPTIAFAAEWTAAPEFRLKATKNGTTVTVELSPKTDTNLVSLEFKLWYNDSLLTVVGDAGAETGVYDQPFGSKSFATVSVGSGAVSYAAARNANAAFAADAAIFTAEFTVKSGDEFEFTVDSLKAGTEGNLEKVYSGSLQTTVGAKQTAAITDLAIAGLNDGKITYTGAPVPAPTYNYNGDGKVSVSWSEKSTEPGGGVLASAPTDAGEYLVEAYAPATENYKEAVASLKFAIAPAKLTSFIAPPQPITLLTSSVTTAAQTKAIALADLFDGYPDLDSLRISATAGEYVTPGAVVSGKLTLNVAADAAPAEETTDCVTLTVTDTKGNIGQEDIPLYITFKSKTDVSDKLTLADASYTYSGKAVALPALRYNGKAVEARYTVTLGGEPVDEIKNAGEYTVTAAYEDDIPEGDLPGHVGTASAKITVAPKTLTIGKILAESKPYDGTAAMLGWFVELKGYVAGEEYLFATAVTADVEWTSAAVGTKTVSIKNIALQGKGTENYVLAETAKENVTVDASITKALPVVEAPLAVAVKAGENITIAPAFTDVALKEGYAEKKPTAVVTDASVASADGLTVNGLTAGTTTVKFTYPEEANFKKATVEVEVTVYPASVKDYYTVTNVGTLDIETLSEQEQSILNSGDPKAEEIKNMLEGVTVGGNATEMAAASVFEDEGVTEWLEGKTDVTVTIRPVISMDIADYYYYGVDRPLTFDIKLVAELTADGEEPYTYPITKLSQPLFIEVTLPEGFVPDYVVNHHTNEDGNEEKLYYVGWQEGTKYVFYADRFSDFEFVDNDDGFTINIRYDIGTLPWYLTMRDVLETENGYIDLLDMFATYNGVKGLRIGEEVYDKLTPEIYLLLDEMAGSEALEAEIAFAKRSSGGGGGVANVKSDINVLNAENAAITVSAKSAYAGSNIVVTVKPNDGFTVTGIKVVDANGNEIAVKGENGSYSFTMPETAVIVSAVIADGEQIFSDVSNSAYYAAAVRWAVANNITKGTSETTFSPDASCTRGQMVTFLFRAAGSPETALSEDFIDVDADAYYAQAVAWALDNGITNGKGKGIFDPDGIVTRAEALTFLYRFSKAVAADTELAFNDVADNDWFAAAVRWGVSNNITNGTTETTFSPNAACVRAQIVTFLYRLLGNK